VAFKITRAGHVVLRATDVPRLKSFLEKIVGFSTYGKAGRDFYFLTSHPVTNHHMIAVRPGKPGERLPDAERQIGMASIAYEMSDAAALGDLYGRLRGAEAAQDCRILAAEDRGAIHMLVFADFDGNRYEFWCPAPGPEAERIQSLALRGALDLAAGPAEPAAPPAPPAKIAIRRTSHLTLRSRDLARAQAFYETALGLGVVAEDERGRRYLAPGDGNRRIVLALEPARHPDAPSPTPKAMFGMEHFSLEVGSFADLQDVWRHFKASGVSVDHTQDHGVTASIYFHDPDGNLMEIYHDVPRAEIAVPEDPFVSAGGIEERLERVG
jgi:catechol 2,3-dioxygenase